jgi:hypothetical protein
MPSYFSDIFNIDEKILEDHGAFNVSLIVDLPLFVDPFLVFKKYPALHDDIIKYLRFLYSKSISAQSDLGQLEAWYYFREIKQNWFGFCAAGNSGSGLAHEFAISLNRNLGLLLSDFDRRGITQSVHLEKLCLIKEGVGKDRISDFTTNLIKKHLAEYTQVFAEKYLKSDQKRKIVVDKVHFNYTTERWEPDAFILPYFNKDYVLLTPKDMLTKDDSWINKTEFHDKFLDIPNSIPDGQLRAEINNYLASVIPNKPQQKDYAKAINLASERYPILIDYYIKSKEDTSEEALKRSIDKVFVSQQVYVEQFGQFVLFLSTNSLFYSIKGDTADEALERIHFLKDIVENKGGWKWFWYKGIPIRREEDIHILYRLTWRNSPSDVSREVNDGRGPADFKISRGSQDKAIVEFKLASNPQIKRNLEHQTEIYKKASDAKTGYKVIFYFSYEEYVKITGILDELNLRNDATVVLVDARADNKPSASKVG